MTGHDEKVPMPRTKAQREQAAATLRAWRMRMDPRFQQAQAEEAARIEEEESAAAALKARAAQAVEDWRDRVASDFPDDEEIPF